MTTLLGVSPHLLWFTIYNVLSSIVYCSWIKSTQHLPRADKNMAIGVWNHTIHILFGENYPQQKTTYYHTTGFVFYGETELSHPIIGSAQFYTQMDNILYLINGHGGSEQNIMDTISTYNMENNQFKLNSYQIHQRVAKTGCIASTANYLFIVGGRYYGTFETCGTGCISDVVQILNLNTTIWSQSRMVTITYSL